MREIPEQGESSEEKRLREFEGNFRTGLGELLELIEMAPDVPLPPDPFSMGFDDRTLEELDVKELGVVRSVLFEELGVVREKAEKATVRTYQTQTPEERKSLSGLVIPRGSIINVTVFDTNRSEQGIVLQELTFPDNEKRWVVGPDTDV